MESGLLMNKKVRVIFKGKDDPLALRHGKEYEAIIGQKGVFCIIDETGEEYAYSPDLFDVVPNNANEYTVDDVKVLEEA